MTLLFSRSYLGMGLDSIEDSLNGESQPSYAFFLKAVFTSLTLAFGGSGGIISIELFGPAVAPYAIVACAVSYLVTGHRSIFPAQRLATGKSSSIRAELDADIQDVRPEFHYRERSLPGVVHALVRALRRKG